MENLDLACAKIGKEIADSESSKDFENLITDALAVLEEQGVYALFLFLKVKKDTTITNKLRLFLIRTPEQTPLFTEQGDVFTSIQDIAEDLDRLLMTRDLIRQVLIYARFHVRKEVNK